MKKELLAEPMLFTGMEETEIEACLTALKAKEKTYHKGDAILHAGDTTDTMGLVLSGSVTIESTDVWGNRAILSSVGKNQVFAETYALIENQPLLVDVYANEDCRILMLKVKTLMSLSDMPTWAIKFQKNLFAITTRKNLTLSKKCFHVSPRFIRERVLTYLSSMAIETGKKEFDIPFDRQHLADYLNVERSSLSKELGDMKKAGLIDTWKYHFKLLV